MWEGQIKKVAHGQKSKKFESTPNQVHTVFGWDLKIIDFRVYLKNCYFI